MTAANLALRFGAELGALAGLAVGAWTLVDGPLRWVAVVAAPLLAAVAWGVFNVPGDPSRSGAAPVAVPGWVRLVVEMMVFGSGVAALLIAARPILAAALAAVVVIVTATSIPRLTWLLRRASSS